MADEFSVRENMENDAKEAKNDLKTVARPIDNKIREKVEDEIGDRIAKHVAEQGAKSAAQAAAQTAGTASAAGAAAGAGANALLKLEQLQPGLEEQQLGVPPQEELPEVQWQVEQLQVLQEALLVLWSE